MDVGIEVDDAIEVAAKVIISALCVLPLFQDMVVDAQFGSDFNLFDFGFPKHPTMVQCSAHAITTVAPGPKPTNPECPLREIERTRPTEL